MHPLLVEGQEGFPDGGAGPCGGVRPPRRRRGVDRSFCARKVLMHIREQGSDGGMACGMPVLPKEARQVLSLRRTRALHVQRSRCILSRVPRSCRRCCDDARMRLYARFSLIKDARGHSMAGVCWVGPST